MTWQDAGWTLTDRDDAFAALIGSLSRPPRLLGLGEPTHGVEAFPELRNQLWRHLVEREGYRSIAIESDAVAGGLVDDYVTRGAGSLEEVMARGFSHGFGASAANRELVSWMRQYNRNCPAADRLRFFGFDAPLEMAGAASPRGVLTALHGYLEADRVSAALIDDLLGDDDGWTNPGATMDPTQSVGGRPEVAQLRVIADDLEAELLARAPELVAATSVDDWHRAHLYGRTAAGLLRYHAGMADTSPARVPRLMGLRDAMMADNLLAIVRSQAQRGPTLVFAHNRHLQREESTWNLGGQLLRWWSAGAIVDAQLDGQYAFAATALGTATGLGLAEPPPDTLEGMLSQLPASRYAFSSRRLAGALGAARDRLTPRTDNSSSNGYFPLDPAHLDRTDALIFLKSA
ncbi:erythromycin esterase [Rhizocola hellebori]|uniref:Erythromycin esterase n=1 Tax=Rhizocola hellebori TaxID=1392758 RepID=A0A8J3VJY9_9ACTN|nr:erythromycin esterase family protein [Rhizocola hellebori]GIH09894.1 erythromycin esterase [Rhizocola hellebori]